jgi:ATP-binding cassette subfamily B protein
MQSVLSRARGALRGASRSAHAVVRQLPRALALVLAADRWAALSLVALGLANALIPVAVAWVGKLLVDGVVQAARTGAPEDRAAVLTWVGVEAALMVAGALVTRAQGLSRSLLGSKLGHLIHLRILDKALTLDIAQLEDSTIQDKLQNARREASARPLNLFAGAVELAGNVLTLASYGVVLFAFDGLALLILAVATLPTFVAEARFSGEAFRIFSWRAPEARRMRYLEVLLTRDSSAKEVRLYGLGSWLLDRYRTLHEQLFSEERALALRRAGWGFLLTTLSTVALYGCYGWIVASAARSQISLGEMTLYVTVFRQGQAALRSILRTIGGSYEDSLFLSNLFDFLDLSGVAAPVRAAIEPVPFHWPRPGAGFALSGVSFRYPGSDRPVLQGLELRIGADEKLAIVGENGAGKTTLIKLLMGLYAPTEGLIQLDGAPLATVPREVLLRRFGAVLQDFAQYQFTARENVGLAVPDALGDLSRIERAAQRGGADEVVKRLAKGWETQLGRWFEGGVELSMGSWQKLAVSRAFMRDADVMILDEPTASLDAEAEHALFLRFRALTEGKMVLLISHRFSTVRMADRILVLANGRIDELGTHAELVARQGRYAHLFALQAAGYLDGPGRAPEPRSRLE